MRTAELDYSLPERLVAQEPAKRRDDARLLALDRASGLVRHAGTRDLPSLLESGDVLVLNDARVIPARVLASRESGGRVEVLFLGPAEAPSGDWHALVRAGGALRAGEVLRTGSDSLRLVEPRGEGEWRVAPVDRSIRDVMERNGAMPLPPYVRREAGDPRDVSDRERYQTVYAREEGAVAAPTAGLHMTEPLLDAIRARGVEVRFLTLRVGLGTFQPVRTDRIEDHPIHAEDYVIPPETAGSVSSARSLGHRVVAVGTTTVRALEAAAAASPDGLPRAGAGVARILIAPGHRFRAVDALLTNFHLPRSTLLALVAAFGGTERVLGAYREAVRLEYRFYSYGDAMFLS